MEERITTGKTEPLRNHTGISAEKTVKAKKWHAHSGHDMAYQSEQRPHFRLNFGNSR